MPPLTSPRIVIWLLQAFPTLFLAILFLQSGIDKVIDFRGNQGYLTQHFGNSPLRGVVTPMLLSLTIIEVSAGVLCAAGLVELLVLGTTRAAFWGIAVAALAFSCALLRAADLQGLHRGGDPPGVLPGGDGRALHHRAAALKLTVCFPGGWRWRGSPARRRSRAGPGGPGWCRSPGGARS